MVNHHTDITSILENIDNHWECERLEYKTNLADYEKIAQTLCALSNSACVRRKPYGYMIRGITDNKSFESTTFDPRNESRAKHKAAGVANLRQRLQIRFKEQIQLELVPDFEYEGNNFCIIKVQAAQGGRPTLFNDIPYVRIFANQATYNDNGNDHPALLQQIYNSTIDHTASITHLKIEDLDEEAKEVFREVLFANPNNHRYRSMSDIEIYRRLSLMKDDYITYGGALLLAKEEFIDDLFSDKGQITWKYEDRKNSITDRRTWKVPFMLCFEEVIEEIERFNTPIVGFTLFRTDVKKYDKGALRELLFNSFIHRDRNINRWIEIRQTPESIRFINPGMFIANLDDVILHGNRPDYRNPHLSNIFKALNYVEKEGGGLKDIVYPNQIKKGLTINEYLEPTQTSFELLGYIKDEEFAKYVINNVNIEPIDLFLLDKIVTGKNKIGIDISKKDMLNLKHKGYIEVVGKRYQTANLSHNFAKHIKKTGVRTRIGGIDREWYEEHIIKHIKTHKKIYYSEVLDICKDKDPTWCSNLLRSMRLKRLIKLEKPEGKLRQERYHILIDRRPIRVEKSSKGYSIILRV